MKAIIGGTSLLNSTVLAGLKRQIVETPYGAVPLSIRDNWVFLQRHGNPPVPPHMINHRANISAMRSLGVTHIVSINSVGSLNTAIPPGSFLVPDDFVSIWQIPTFHDKDMRFMVPQMDLHLANSLYGICKKLIADVQLGGVYIQTLGPRLETKAEIRMLKAYGDIIGMTMASEATLCLECQIPYASLCSIDNYCNGIVETPLTMREIEENVADNIEKVLEVIEALVVKDIE